MNLRHVITFQKLEYVEDDFNDVPPTWVDALKTRCKVESISSSESQVDDQTQPVSTIRLRCRYDGRITDDMRIKMLFAKPPVPGGETRDRIYSIESVVNENERNRWLLIDCHEVT